MLGGLPERRDAATRWPFTSPAACSIFNVSQLTAALAGSLVRNATHASVAWQAHASDGVVVAPHGHQTKHRGGEEGAYGACDWEWRYWSDRSGICISLEDCVPAGSGWLLLPPLPPLLLAAASAGSPGLRCPSCSASEQRARWGAAGSLCGCSLRVQTRVVELHYRAPYWPGRLSCGSDQPTCFDRLLGSLGDCSLLLNIKE